LTTSTWTWARPRRQAADVVATAVNGLATAVDVLASVVAAVHELSWKMTAIGLLFLAELVGKAQVVVEHAAVGVVHFGVLIGTSKAEITAKVEHPHEAAGAASACTRYVTRVSRLLLCLLPVRVTLRPRNRTTTRTSRKVTSWAMTTTTWSRHRRRRPRRRRRRLHPASDASAIDPPAPFTPIVAAAEGAVAMIAAAAARTDSDASFKELSDDADKDEEEPDHPKVRGRNSRGRVPTSAAAQWAGANAQGGSDVHLDSASATDKLQYGDYQRGRNRRGRIATTAACPLLPPRRLGTGRRARSAASLAYAEVTCASSLSSSSENEKGCDYKEDLCTAAASHSGRAVQNGRLRAANYE